MNKRIIKCALLLALCAMNVKGWAQDSETVIFSEDFSELEWSNSVWTYGGWTLTNCESMYYIKNGNPQTDRCVLKIDPKANATQSNGSATTPLIVGMTKEVVLTFSYANAQSSGVSNFTVTTSSGYFEESNASVCAIRIGSGKINHQEKVLLIRDADSEGTISFTWQSGTSFALSSVIVSTVPLITISESSSNATTLSDNNGKIANVTLGRTFAAGIWNTLCLPFDVTTESVKTAFGQTDTPGLRVFNSVDENTMKFIAPDGTISAGTPFLLKLATECSNPVFTGVTISSTAAQTVIHGDYSFTGTYSPVEITDASALFLNSQGKLFKVKSDDSNHTLAGLRAYFTVPANAARPLISIDDADGTATGISPSTIHQNLSTRYYTLSGRPITTPTASGIYIVRQADGTTRKIIKN